MTLGVAAPRDEERFLDLVLRNSVDRPLLARLGALGTPDTWLVAGRLFQIVWNLASGRPPTGDIAKASSVPTLASDIRLRRAIETTCRSVPPQSFATSTAGTAHPTGLMSAD